MLRTFDLKRKRAHRKSSINFHHIMLMVHMCQKKRIEKEKQPNSMHINLCRDLKYCCGCGENTVHWTNNTQCPFFVLFLSIYVDIFRMRTFAKIILHSFISVCEKKLIEKHLIPPKETNMFAFCLSTGRASIISSFYMCNRGLSLNIL